MNALTWRRPTANGTQSAGKCTLGAWIILAWLAGITGSLQGQPVESGAANTPQNPTPSQQDAGVAVTDLSAQDAALNVQQIQQRIQQLEAATDGDAAARTRLLDTYRQILQRAESARTNTEKSQAFRASITSAPAEITRLRAQITALQSTDSSATLADLPQDITAEQAQSQLTLEQSALTGLRTRLADLEKRQAAEDARPPVARTQLAEARTILAQIELDLAASSVAAEAAETEQVQRTLLETRQRARLAEIQMLEQELLSNPIRIELLTVSRDLASRQVNLAEIRIKAFEARISELRQAESERARQEAERLRREAIGKHQVIRSEAEEINEITTEAQRLSPLIDQARGRRGATESELEQITADLEETRQTLELGNITETVGAVLLEQRRSLRSEGDLELAAEEIAGLKASASLRLFQIERQLRQLADVERVGNQLLEGTEELPASEAEKQELATELGEMLKTKRGHLDQLAQSYRAYKTELLQWETAHEELSDRTGQLAQVLDENLLWIRNAKTLSWTTVVTSGDRIKALAKHEGWSELAADIRADVSDATTIHLAFAAFLAVLLATRRGIIARLEAQAPLIGKVREDRMGLTLRALAFTFLLAVPVAAILQFVGWRLATASAHNDLGRAVGTAAMVSALTFLVIRFVRAACRPMGLGEEHFRWNPANLRLIRRHLV